MIKQKAESDCFLCCLAMASGKDYDTTFTKELRDEIERKKTCSGKDLDLAYELAGYKRGIDYETVYAGNGQVINIEFAKSMLWKRKAILQVRSLNFDKGEHAIYWDGEQLFDPSNKMAYQFLSSVFPTYITIFHIEKNND